MFTFLRYSKFIIEYSYKNHIVLIDDIFSCLLPINLTTIDFFQLFHPTESYTVENDIIHPHY